jgi:hypothetical protein
MTAYRFNVVTQDGRLQALALPGISHPSKINTTAINIRNSIAITWQITS